ncbi:hypothetical protein AnigIFM60653_005737 [Aspergillus niger]|nr:hypothetical protein AnigIFM60653_005737 [Aspergillus niger]
MTPPVDEVRAGFVVSVAQAKNKDGDPTVFSATQIPTVNSLPLVPPPSTRSTQSIDFSSGPVKESFAEPLIIIDTFQPLYLWNALIDIAEVWLHYDIEVSFDGHFKDDVHLLTI